MYIPQAHLKNIDDFLIQGKVLVIYGPRRVGKTTLIETYLKKINESFLFVNGEDITVQAHLSSQSVNKLTDFVGNHHLLVVDEAQNIEQIGLNLKLIVDHIPDIKIIATGSSSFDLSKNMGEPLTGRKYTLRLFPLSQMEISSVEKQHETEANLESRLIYGSYPEVITMHDNSMRKVYLRELVGAYLFKDIFQHEGIKYANKLTRLLQLIAFQIGKEVSHTELGKQLGMGKNTVDRYLDLLEKVFVLFRLTGFSRNLRKEISKSNRYFFFDLGIRNALINNFNQLDIRNDVGQLWENYVIVERMKKLEYSRMDANNYFWRTYDKKEIDLIEEYGGKLCGYEMKWRRGSAKIHREWLETYPDSTLEIISKNNYLNFIT